jgi:gliding motility-associated-like protein
VDEAFTPNGDNRNDMLVARGIGIEELVEFSIYNRWGIKVFSTNVWVAQEGVSEGWDGTYEGKEQRQ